MIKIKSDTMIEVVADYIKNREANKNTGDIHICIGRMSKKNFFSKLFAKLYNVDLLNGFYIFQQYVAETRLELLNDIEKVKEITFRDGNIWHTFIKKDLPEIKPDVVKIDEKKIEGLNIKKLLAVRKELEKQSKEENKSFYKWYCGVTEETQEVVVNDLNTISKMEVKDGGR